MEEKPVASGQKKKAKNRTEVKFWLLKMHNSKLMSIAKSKGITMAGLIRMILIEYLERIE